MLDEQGSLGKPIQKTHIKTHIDQVTILHATHPLRGQTFAVVRQTTEGIFIQVANEDERQIALEWTDQVIPPVVLPGAYFLLENLVILRQRLDGHCHKERCSGKILLQEDQQPEGGSDGKVNSVHSDAIIAGATGADNSHISANDLASVEQARGGKKK